MENIYYVYLHRRADDNEVFYVGKGKGYRAKHRTKRNSWWQNIVAKHGFIVEYVEKGLSESDALDLEVETIKFYRDNGHTLCNLTDGGEGTSGYRHPPELRAKQKALRSTPEHRAKVSKAHGKPVLCSNGMVFDSSSDAARWLGDVMFSSSISRCCRRDYLLSQGYVWRYLDDAEDLIKCLDDGLDPLKALCTYTRDYSKVSKKVYCSNGMCFASVSSVARWLIESGVTNGSNLSSVSECCNGKRETLYGLQFSFEDKFSNSSTSSPASLAISCSCDDRLSV